MEITTEFLNKIQGKPEWLEVWSLASDSEGLTQFAAKIAEERRETGSLWVVMWPPHGRIEVSCETLNELEAKELFELATYARRVEIEIQQKNEAPYFSRVNSEDPVKDDLDEVIEDLICGCCYEAGEVAELEVSELCRRPISHALPALDWILEDMDERYFDADGLEDCHFEALAGAEEALEVWAETYIKKPDAFSCDHVGDFMVSVRITKHGWERIKDDKESEVVNAT